MNQKAQVCEECKSDYASTLQHFNTTQQEHFYTTMPQVFQVRATTMPQAFQVHATTMPQVFQVRASPPKNIGDGCSSQQFWRWIYSPLVAKVVLGLLSPGQLCSSGMTLGMSANI